MNPTSTFLALGSAILVAACSSLGSSGAGSDAQSADKVQWKSVTRLSGGQFVTYRVPVNEQVNNNVNFHSFDPSAQPTQAAGAAQGSNAGQAVPASSAAGSESAAAKTPPLLPLVGSNEDAPLFGSPASDVGQTGHPAKAATASEPNISEDAETTLGQAEIAVRDAQSRFETAKKALDRARSAAQAGDSFVVIEYARTAITLSHPGH
ncbi:MAG: hypothetical protein ACREX6_10795 [Casimicrobiaceae bacterium]